MKIIWLKTGPLHPLDTGGKIRTCNMLRELKKLHHVTYLSLCPPNQDPATLASAAEYSHEQIWIPWAEAPKRSVKFFTELLSNIFSPLPYVIAKYCSPAMLTRLKELEATGDYDLIICDFLTPAINLGRAGELKTPVLLFQHNVESQIWERLAGTATGLKKIYFTQQWRRLQKFEATACARANGVVAVSDEDCKTLRQLFSLKNVLGSVPTGVDVEYFSTSNPQRRPQSLVFLGSMDWMPNIDGAKFFIEESFPLVRQKYADATLTIVGRNPPAHLKELAAKTPGLRVTGTVDDVRPYLAEAEVMIVPLRVGGGTRIKIFEGMATGIPVVSTTIGAEGLPVTHRENILLADTPADFAAQICVLFADKEQRARIGENGLKMVKEKFGWAAATEIFGKYCVTTIKGSKG